MAIGCLNYTASSNPNTIIASPFALSADGSVDDPHVRRVNLHLDASKQPLPELEEFTITIDNDLTTVRKSQLMSLLRFFVHCFSFEGCRLGKVNLRHMTVSVSDA